MPLSEIIGRLSLVRDAENEVDCREQADDPHDRVFFFEVTAAYRNQDVGKKTNRQTGGEPCNRAIGEPPYW